VLFESLHILVFLHSSISGSAYCNCCLDEIEEGKELLFVFNDEVNCLVMQIESYAMPGIEWFSYCLLCMEVDRRACSPLSDLDQSVLRSFDQD
jgi:hypothetical protein